MQRLQLRKQAHKATPKVSSTRKVEIALSPLSVMNDGKNKIFPLLKQSSAQQKKLLNKLAAIVLEFLIVTWRTEQDNLHRHLFVKSALSQASEAIQGFFKQNGMIVDKDDISKMAEKIFEDFLPAAEILNNTALVEAMVLDAQKYMRNQMIKSGLRSLRQTEMYLEQKWIIQGALDKIKKEDKLKKQILKEALELRQDINLYDKRYRSGPSVLPIGNTLDELDANVAEFALKLQEGDLMANAQAGHGLELVAAILMFIVSLSAFYKDYSILGGITFFLTIVILLKFSNTETTNRILRPFTRDSFTVNNLAPRFSDHILASLEYGVESLGELVPEKKLPEPRKLPPKREPETLRTSSGDKKSDSQTTNIGSKTVKIEESESVEEQLVDKPLNKLDRAETAPVATSISHSSSAAPVITNTARPQSKAPVAKNTTRPSPDEDVVKWTYESNNELRTVFYNRNQYLLHGIPRSKERIIELWTLFPAFTPLNGLFFVLIHSEDFFNAFGKKNQSLHAKFFMLSTRAQIVPDEKYEGFVDLSSHNEKEQKMHVLKRKR